MSSIIPDRYGEILPRRDNLCDEAILIQAWKKSHEYIRRHNWYSDCLELDVSSSALMSFLNDLRVVLSATNIADYIPSPMRMVPAPKSHQWKLNSDGWFPAADEAKQFKLRPLAHLSIVDQTISTAILMCLANSVETKQGDPTLSEDVKLTGIHQTVSYGNRLLCGWKDGEAKFRWGNAQLYRQYSTDYQTYLARTTSQAGRFASPDVVTLIVRSDLSQCYDRIQCGVLIDKLKRVTTECGRDEPDERFFEFLKQAFAWRWHDDDKHHVDGHLPSGELDPHQNGHPQGLAASGFLCNAYLLELDQAIVDSLSADVPAGGWNIVDYCRYVDDMSFVVQHDPALTDDQVVEEFEGFLQAMTEQHAPDQVVHDGKTKHTSLDRLGRSMPLADTMMAIQREVSGPMDVTTAEQVLGMLDGLFQKGAAKAVETPGFGDDSPLSVLFNSEPDVRTTTVDRFVANRWKSVYRTLRLMTGGDPSPLGSLDSDSRLLDQRAVEFSKELIRRWIDDPSNVRLLRIAFDIFPCVGLLNPVLSLLRGKLFINDDIDPNVRQTCIYVASELFKAASIETGLASDPDFYPSQSNVDEYRERLKEFGQECVENIGNEAWYLSQQIVVFFATLGESPELLCLGESAGPRYAGLQELIKGEVSPTTLPAQESVSLIVLIKRILGDGERAADLLVESYNAHFNNQFLEAMRLVLAEDEELAVAFVRRLPSNHQPYWNSVLEQYGICDPPSDGELQDGKWYRLATILRHKNNPFRQEIAAIRLMVGLVQVWAEQQGTYGYGNLTPSRIEVNCRDWTRLNHPDTFGVDSFFCITIHAATETTDERFDVPSWCVNEQKWKVEIAQVVRASIIGDCNYSTMLRDGTQHNVRRRYRGIRTSWVKRKHGLYNGRSVLGGWDVPVSPWLSDVLTVFLAWPGTSFEPRVATVGSGVSRSDLAETLSSRLHELAGDFGRMIGTPIYRCPVKAFRPPKDAGKITIGLVQMSLPRDEHFKEFGVHLSDPSYRKRHRRLLTAILKLLQKTIEVRNRAEDSHTTLDLVVLPELAVHIDDLVIVQRFIDKVRCMVFCGLVFHDHPFSTEQTINSGVWIIPQFTENGRDFITIEQGKQFLTEEEEAIGITPYRPCQWIIEDTTVDKGWRLSAAICKDMTDANLHADMKDLTDGLIVSALNRDVRTFDGIVSACHYTMFNTSFL